MGKRTGGPPLNTFTNAKRAAAGLICVISARCRIRPAIRCSSSKNGPGIASEADLIAHSMKVRRLMFRFDGRYQYRRGAGYCEVGYVSADRLPFRRRRNSLQSVGTLKV